MIPALWFVMGGLVTAGILTSSLLLCGIAVIVFVVDAAIWYKEKYPENK